MQFLRRWLEKRSELELWLVVSLVGVLVTTSIALVAVTLHAYWLLAVALVAGLYVYMKPVVTVTTDELLLKMRASCQQHLAEFRAEGQADPEELRDMEDSLAYFDAQLAERGL